MNVNYAIVFVSDMSRSVAFYRDTVGLTLRFETPEWTEFATGDATLALHVSRTGKIAGETDEEIAAGRCRPGFSVPDVDEFHARMMSHGVVCVEEPRDVFGARLAQYADPDGLVFSIGEERKAG